MKKKEKNSSSSKERKKFIKITFTNNKKNLQLKQKQRLNKSMDKKKNIGIYLPTEPNKNIIEERNQNNRIHLTKQRKDKTTIYNSSYIKSRSIKTNKVREYENTLNKLNEDSINEKEREKDFDFLYFKYNKEREKERSNTYKPENDMRYKSNYIKSAKINNSKNSKMEDNFKESLYEAKEKNVDDSSDDDLRNEDDILYRTLYRPSLTKKSLLFKNDKEKEKEKEKDKDKEKEKKDKELSDSKEKTVSHPTSQYIINSNNLNYSMNNKKYNSNEKKNSLYNNYRNNTRSNYRKESEDSKEYRRKVDSYNDSTIYYSKSFGYLSNERAVDLYVIDTDGEEPNVSSRNRRKINRKRNIVKEIKIEKFDKYHPLRNEKLTGFVLIRKSRGKRVYDIELEDNIDKINEILKNKEIMIKNEIIQFITLQQLNNYEQEIRYYNGKISRLQNDLRKKDSSLEKIGDKDKELEKEKDDQISSLKAKIEELNKIIFNKQEELDQNIREFKQVKLAYDLLQDSIEKDKIEKEPTPEQIYKHKKKAQMQKNEENDQKEIKEIKIRIKKYKDELKRVPTNESSRRVSIISIKHDDSNFKDNKSPKKKQVISKDIKDIKELKENPINPQIGSSDDDDNIELYNLGEDEGKDPKKRKMKNAVNRFKKKYHDVIKEEKKLKKQKEKEEREREENEEKELEDDNYENKEDNLKEQKEREEKERRVKEEKEREERERKEKEEMERREREERERREREEKEKREKEEMERRQREEREKREKEEMERRQREERERKEREERERREREEKERKEKEKKIKEVNEKKEKGARPGQNKMMGGNFAKMLANKLKVAPPGGKKVGFAPKRGSTSKPPIIEKNVDMVELLENQPFKERKGRKKPTKKLFVEEE